MHSSFVLGPLAAFVLGMKKVPAAAGQGSLMCTLLFGVFSCYIFAGHSRGASRCRAESLDADALPFCLLAQAKQPFRACSRHKSGAKWQCVLVFGLPPRLLCLPVQHPLWARKWCQIAAWRSLWKRAFSLMFISALAFSLCARHGNGASCGGWQSPWATTRSSAPSLPASAPAAEISPAAAGRRCWAPAFLLSASLHHPRIRREPVAGCGRAEPLGEDLLLRFFPSRLLSASPCLRRRRGAGSWCRLRLGVRRPMMT